MINLQGRPGLYAGLFLVFLGMVFTNHWVFSGASQQGADNRTIASDESLSPTYLEVDWERRANELLEENQSKGIQGYGEEPAPMEALALGTLQGKPYDFEVRDQQIFGIELRTSPEEFSDGELISVESQRGAEISNRLAFLNRYRGLLGPEISRVLQVSVETGDEGLVEKFELYSKGNQNLGLVKIQLDSGNRLLSLSVQ